MYQQTPSGNPKRYISKCKFANTSAIREHATLITDQLIIFYPLKNTQIKTRAIQTGWSSHQSHVKNGPPTVVASLLVASLVVDIIQNLNSCLGRPTVTLRPTKVNVTENYVMHKSTVMP